MRWIFLSIIVVLATAADVQAQAVEGPVRGVGVGLRASTMGPGLEVSRSLGNHFAVRIGANYLSYTYRRAFTKKELNDYVDSDQELFDMDVAGTVDYFSAAGLVDWYPFRRVFRLTGGLFVNTNAVDVGVAAASPYKMNDVEYSAADMGELRAKISFPLLAPYVGLGLGNAAVGSRVTLLFDLGVLYSGRPRFEMEGSGMIEPTAEQAPDIEAKMAMYRLYPVLSFGAAFRI